MPDWNSPEELAKDGRKFSYDIIAEWSLTFVDVAGVFVNVIFVFFGLYLWEFTTTCDFEWSLITRKRKFTWPLVCSHCCDLLLTHSLTHCFFRVSSLRSCRSHNDRTLIF